jgi:hypothetical protein
MQASRKVAVTIDFDNLERENMIRLLSSVLCYHTNMTAEEKDLAAQLRSLLMCPTTTN